MASLVVSKFSFHIQIHSYLLLQLKGVAALSFLEKKSVKIFDKSPSQKNKRHLCIPPQCWVCQRLWARPKPLPASGDSQHLPWADHQALSYTVVPGKDGPCFIFFSSKTKQQTLAFILLQIKFIFLNGHLLNHFDRGTWERPAEQCEHFVLF